MATFVPKGIAKGDLQVEMLQDIFVAVGVLEGDVLEFDVAVDRLPVLLLRLEVVTVEIDDLLRVVHVRLRLQQLGKPLDVDLGRDKIGEGVVPTSLRAI